tara:strand:- start:338 stop:484 length:147 start_codon:yes stop_codon:yes gene_type:complete
MRSCAHLYPRKLLIQCCIRQQNELNKNGFLFAAVGGKGFGQLSVSPVL